MEARVRAPLAEIVELETLVSRFPPDAVLAMQNTTDRYAGRKAIAHYLASPAAGSLGRLALVATRANCEPAIAVYRYDVDDKVFRAYSPRPASPTRSPTPSGPRCP